MEKVNIEDVSGGSRQDVPASSVPDNAFTKIKNFRYDHTGALATRDGCTAFNASAIAATLDNGTRFYRPTTAVVKTLVSADTGANVKVYVADDGAGTFAEVTGGTALTTALPMNYLTFRDTLFMVNGTQTMQYFTNGTTKANCVFSDNDRKGKYIATASNRVFVAGDPNAKNTVWISGDSLFTVAPGTDCSFPADGYINIQGEKNDYIIGLASINDICYVWRRRDVRQILGAESINSLDQREVLTDIGATNQKAIATTPYGFVFCSDTSVWLWNPNGGISDLGVYVADTINSADFSTAVCQFIPTLNVVYVSYKATTASTYNDVGLEINFGTTYPNGEPTVVENDVPSAAFISCDGAGDTRKVYRLSPLATGATQGVMYLMNTGNDDAGTDFTATLKTKHYAFGDGDQLKLPRTLRMGLYAQTATDPVDVTCIFDRGASTKQLSSFTVGGFNNWGSFIYGQAPYGGGLYQFAVIHVNFGLQGRECQFQFVVDNGVPLTLYRYSVEYQTRPLRGR